MFGTARISNLYIGGGGAGYSPPPSGPSWDISTATTSYTGTARIGEQDGTPTEVYFKPDGTKMYVVGDTNNRVNEYTLSTAWNVFTATYSTFISTNTQEGSPNAVAFSADGTKMYVLGQGTDTVYQYTLSTAWLVSSATYASKSVLVSGQGETVPTALEFNNDGTIMYVLGSVMDIVYQWSLSTAWDVSTATYASKSFSVATQATNPQSVRLLDSGTKMYVLSNNVVYQYTLSTAWDVSTATYASKSMNTTQIGGYESNALGIYFKPDGTRIFLVGTTYDYAWSINLGTAYDISTWSFSTTDNYRLGTNDSTPLGIRFNTDGTKFYFLGGGNDRVYEYSCSTPWDINTTTYTGGRFIAVGTQEANGQDLAFSSDGTKMYIIGQTSDSVYQYTLSTAWLITSATYASKSFSVTSQESFPTGITFSDDGTKMYVIGEGNKTVYQYTLSTAWDVSTASYASKSFSTTAQDALPSSLAIGNSGTKLYVLGYNSDKIYQYTMSTAWDISTASYDSKSLSTLNVDHQAFGIDIAANGSKIYAVGQNLDRLVQWSLT